MIQYFTFDQWLTDLGNVPVPLLLKAPNTTIPWKADKTKDGYLVLVGHKINSQTRIHGGVEMSRQLYGKITRIRAAQSVRVEVHPKDKDHQYVRFEAL